jgi:hypothetical protein
MSCGCSRLRSVRQLAGLVRDHFCFLYDTFSLLVLLALLEGLDVFPSEAGLAAVAIDICNCVKSCDQDTVFFWPKRNVNSEDTKHNQ